MAQPRVMAEAVPARHRGRRTTTPRSATPRLSSGIWHLRQGVQPRTETWAAARAAIPGMLPTPTAAQWAELSDDDDDDDALDDRELRDIAGNGD
eukprot:1433781-Prymnesium_polylepis.1